MQRLNVRFSLYGSSLWIVKTNGITFEFEKEASQIKIRI